MSSPPSGREVRFGHLVEAEFHGSCAAALRLALASRQLLGDATFGGDAAPKIRRRRCDVRGDTVGGRHQGVTPRGDTKGVTPGGYQAEIQLWDHQLIGGAWWLLFR